MRCDDLSFYVPRRNEFASRGGHKAGPGGGVGMRVVDNLLIHTSLTLFHIDFFACVLILGPGHEQAAIGTPFAEVN